MEQQADLTLKMTKEEILKSTHDVIAEQISFIGIKPQAENSVRGQLNRIRNEVGRTEYGKAIEKFEINKKIHFEKNDTIDHYRNSDYGLWYDNDEITLEILQSQIEKNLKSIVGLERRAKRFLKDVKKGVFKGEEYVYRNTKSINVPMYSVGQNGTWTGDPISKVNVRFSIEQKKISAYATTHELYDHGVYVSFENLFETYEEAVEFKRKLKEHGDRKRWEESSSIVDEILDKIQKGK